MKSPCGAEQASLWLHRDGEEPKTDLISGSLQQVSCMRIEVADFETQRVLRSAKLQMLGRKEDQNLSFCVNRRCYRCWS